MIRLEDDQERTWNDAIWMSDDGPLYRRAPDRWNVCQCWWNWWKERLSCEGRQSEEMQRRRKMDGRPTEALMCHLILTLRDTKTGGLRFQSWLSWVMQVTLSQLHQDERKRSLYSTTSLTLFPGFYFISPMRRTWRHVRQVLECYTCLLPYSPRV